MQKSWLQSTSIAPNYEIQASKHIVSKSSHHKFVTNAYVE